MAAAATATAAAASTVASAKATTVATAALPACDNHIVHLFAGVVEHGEGKMGVDVARLRRGRLTFPVM